MNIFVGVPTQPAERVRLQEATQADIFFAESDDLLGPAPEALAEAEVVFGNISPALIASTQRLRWLQLASTGVDAYRGIDWAQRRPAVAVTNLSGTFADPVAETCLAGILALQRRISDLAGLKVDRRWIGSAMRPSLQELNGSCVVILGAGSIARRLAELLSIFNCVTTMFGRQSGDIHTLDSLDLVLPEADVVCCLLPDTSDTRGLMNASRLRRLKSSAIFVNAGRGSVVDENELSAALREGRIGGAVLDVTASEPLPSDSSLWDCPNTVLTQHTAGGSNREIARLLDVFIDNLSRFSNGRPLVNIVDWNRGY